MTEPGDGTEPREIETVDLDDLVEFAEMIADLLERIAQAEGVADDAPHMDDR